MPRDRDRGDSISPSTGQSKRPPNQQDSDSLDSDQAQLGQAQHNQQQRAQSKPQRHHHVGAGGRVYGRVPSSKGLHKHTSSASSAKLTRRVTSPSPDRSAGLASSSHRRHPSSSEVKLSRPPSITNLKNHTNSQAALKRNKSHVEVAKRSKPSAQLKRSSSEKAVNKLKSTKSAVHFDLGNDGQQEDEWIDASSSASPYLSRRGSVATSGQSSANAQGGYYGIPAVDLDGDDEPTPLAEPQRLLFDDNREHSRNLTSRLLQRTPSHSATTGTSNMTALARATSPDSRHSTSTLSVTSGQPQGMVGSNGQEDVTSRFVTQASGGSYFTTGGAGQLDLEPKTPHSVSDVSGPTNNGLSGATEFPDDDGDDDDADNDDDHISAASGVTSSAIATTARSRKVGAVQAAPPEKSRTQQKINLQRASSSMEPVRHRHSGIGGFAAEVAEVAGPLLGGAGYESQDPRVNKLLERTGVEYNIVRRYQNPVGRSLVRLAQLPGNDKARRIPQPGTSGGGNRQSVQSLGAGQLGLSQSFKDVRESGSGGRRPPVPKRAYSTARHGGLSSSVETDDGAAAARMHDGQGLSGASLVNGEDDDGIQALLRSMWDKNLDLSSSHD
ncbi:hypothetical protein VM1G_05177 [Cytospora mali]|uniref:Uncharacterized protein n=1 Tax=Cytospora mali TaxID=578113 RepID=A0A194VZJ4_CYTMA|nr:hypothetical protein VM1G_05177 [Valsa mali]